MASMGEFVQMGGASGVGPNAMAPQTIPTLQGEAQGLCETLRTCQHTLDKLLGCPPMMGGGSSPADSEAGPGLADQIRASRLLVAELAQRLEGLVERIGAL